MPDTCFDPLLDGISSGAVSVLSDTSCMLNYPRDGWDCQISVFIIECTHGDDFDHKIEKNECHHCSMLLRELKYNYKRRCMMIDSRGKWYCNE